MQLGMIQIQYILTLFRHGNDCDVQNVEIAKAMEVTEPSAFRRLQQLIDMGLVLKTRNRCLRLTPDGQNIARELKRKYDAIYPFFAEMLGLSAEEANRLVCYCLGNLCEASQEKMVGSLTEFELSPGNGQVRMALN